MQTHDLGRVFTHAISLDPKSKRLHTAPTHEVDSPYRWSNSLVVRVWRSYGFVLGWWRNTQRTEEQALLAALQAHTDVDLLDDDGYLREEFERGYVDV